MYILPVCAVIGYILGSISGSIIISKVFFKEDIRKQGSGNAGMTNSLRVYGKGAAALTVLIDILKTVAAGIIGRALAEMTGIDGVYGIMASGAAVMLGHAFPLFFGFKGGKSVICIAIVVSFISWQTVLIALLVFAIIVACTKIVSAGSCMAMIAAIIAAACLRIGLKEFIFVTAACIFVIFMHRANIVRIFNKTEKKITDKGGKNT